MANGYRTPDGDGLGPLIRQLEDLQRRLKELETPTGTSLNSLVAQVQEAIAEIGTTINAWLLANSYTKAQIDALVASPGAIAPTTVNASGTVTSGGDVNAAGYVRGGNIYGNILSVDYRVVYVTGVDGALGHVPSSAKYKTDIHPANLDLEALFSVDVHTFKYKDAIAAYGSVEAAPTELGLIAEEVDAAGLGYLVYRGADGSPEGVAYERLGLPLLSVAKDHEARLRAIEQALGL